MQTLAVVDPERANGATRQLMDRVAQRLGRVPQMFRLLANSPAAAEAYLQFNLALAQAALPAQTRALIAVALAETGDCAYSRVIARAQAAGNGVTEEAVAAAVKGEAVDAKTTAALHFAQQAVQAQGHLPPQAVAGLRAAGYGDAEVVEIVACIALNLFRNYFNLIAGTEIDPPPAAVQPALQ